MIFGAKIKDNVANDVTRWGILADGIWNFTGHDVGPYAIVTVGFRNPRCEMSYLGYSESIDSSGMVYGVGVGYKFTNRFAIEFKHMFGPGTKWDDLAPAALAERRKEIAREAKRKGKKR
jgi:hypothetical protein